MKKGRNLIILVTILALLCGGLFYINSHPKKKANNTPTDTTQIDITKFDSKKIVKLDLSTKMNNLSILKKGNNWQIESKTDVKLLQTAIDNLLSTFSAMTAQKLIGDNISDLEQYGLKTPYGTASISLDDGSVKTFYLGNKTPDGNSYYLMDKDSKKVYTVAENVGQSFESNFSSLADIAIPQINAQTISYCKFTNKGEKTVEFNLNNSQSDNEKNYNINGWIMISPYSKPYNCNDTKLSDIFKAIPSLQATGLVDTNAENLSKYGLDKPSLDLTIKDDKITVHFLFGNDKDADNVYFKLDSSKSVYTCSKSSISVFNVKPFDLVGKFAALINIDDVDKIDIQGPKGTNVVTFTRTTKKAEKAGDKDEVVTTYKADNKEIKEDVFKKWYQELIGLSFDAENDKNVSENPEYTTTYYMNKGDKKPIVVKYCPYNSDFYAVYRDGKAEFLIAKDQLIKMQTDLQALIK